MKDVASLLPRVIGPFDSYCSSSGLLPTSAYITAPLIATGLASMECSHSGSKLLDQIIAFDRAEASFANITQTNMVTVSSFNGLSGLILGYDLLKQELKPFPVLDPERYPNVFDAEPLFQATQALFGTIRDKRFPIAPGQHLLCAYKSLYKDTPCMMYGALGIGIARDRSRNADLFMEDHGTVVATHNRDANREQQTMVIENLVKSIHRVGENLGVEYERIFVGLKVKLVGPGEIGCVITAAPYIHLAQNAVPGDDPGVLENLSLAEWENSVRSGFLSAQIEV